jgi:hypothetical protein
MRRENRLIFENKVPSILQEELKNFKANHSQIGLSELKFEAGKSCT